MGSAEMLPLRNFGGIMKTPWLFQSHIIKRCYSLLQCVALKLRVTKTGQPWSARPSTRHTGMAALQSWEQYSGLSPWSLHVDISCRSLSGIKIQITLNPSNEKGVSLWTVFFLEPSSPVAFKPLTEFRSVHRKSGWVPTTWDTAYSKN